MSDPVSAAEAKRPAKAEALAFLLLAQAVLRLGGFSRACRVLGLGSGSRYEEAPDDLVLAKAREVAAGMMRAGDILSTPADCLPQSLAAAAMLRRRGIRPRLHLGVAKSQSDATQLYAHAWLSVGSFIVTGGGASGGYVELTGKQDSTAPLPPEITETRDQP